LEIVVFKARAGNRDHLDALLAQKRVYCGHRRDDARRGADKIAQLSTNFCCSGKEELHDVSRLPEVRRARLDVYCGITAGWSGRQGAAGGRVSERKRGASLHRPASASAMRNAPPAQCPACVATTCAGLGGTIKFVSGGGGCKPPSAPSTLP
jgi:hypothetical protein